MSWVLGQSLINGLLAGGIYSLIAVGITIIFGVMKMVNFAAGSYLVWGMYFTWLWYSFTGLNAYLLIPLVVISMAAFAFVTFRLSIHPVLNTGDTTFILVTIGLSFFLQNLAEFVFGTTPKSVPSAIKNGSFVIGNFSIGHARLIAFGVMLILVYAVNLLLNKTLFGRAMRATAEKPEVAKMLGINTDKTYTLAFVIGVVFAGLSGLLLTPIYYVTPTAGSIFRTSALMVVVLGGMGSIKGAFVGGLLVGVAEALVGGLISADLGPVGICVLFLIILYVRPQGLFGKGERVA